MAADGSRGPRPFQQRHARTLFVRVPVADWPMVKRGMRRTFVGSIGRQSAMFDVQTPTPVVAYSIVRKAYEHKLMVLEDVRQEMLGALDPAELGFESMAHFRRYWMQREGRRFPPTRKVFVYRVAPWSEHSRGEIADLLLARLYGEFLDG